MNNMAFVAEDIFSPLPPQLSEADIVLPLSIEVVQQNCSGLSDKSNKYTL